MGDLISKEELAALGLNPDEDEKVPEVPPMPRRAPESKGLVTPPVARASDPILSQAEIDALLARLQAEG